MASCNFWKIDNYSTKIAWRDNSCKTQPGRNLFSKIYVFIVALCKSTIFGKERGDSSQNQ